MKMLVGYFLAERLSKAMPGWKTNVYGMDKHAASAIGKKGPCVS
jgi:hypothetical protein